MILHVPLEEFVGGSVSQLFHGVGLLGEVVVSDHNVVKLAILHTENTQNVVDVPLELFKLSLFSRTVRT